MTAKAAAAVVPPPGGNGSSEIAAPAVPPSQTCPHAGGPCTKIPACALLANTGKTYCVEWVEAQRAIGRQQLQGEGRP